MNNSLNWALNQTARRLNVDPKLVESVYRSFWGFIKDNIPENRLGDMSLEELKSIDTNFNIPFIGKLYVDYETIQKYNRQLKFYQNVKCKKNKANRQSSVSE